jgi:hypothetical protein
MPAASGNKMLSIEFPMLLILLLVIKTINASTVPAAATPDEPNKCEQISITNCPELKYNHTMGTVDERHRVDFSDANELVSFRDHFHHPPMMPTKCVVTHNLSQFTC